MNNKVGFIFAYVNSEDPVWYKSYYDEMVKRGQKPDRNNVRFRDYGTLKYIFRGVAKYMPYITDVIMIVSGPSQVPKWVNTNMVRIVYHKNYIPEKFLPTFSSNTILSMLYRIPDLPRYLIHSNDDMFVMNDTRFDQFFKDGLPCMKFKKYEKIETSIWRNLCQHNMEKAAELAHAKIEDDKIILPIHHQMPMLSDTLKTVGGMCENDIFKAVSFQRQGDNFSEYLFYDYEYYTNHYVDSYDFKTKYIDFRRNPGDISRIIKDRKMDLLCINDGQKLDPSTFALYKKALHMAFDSVFPNKCKYEI